MGGFIARRLLGVVSVIAATTVLVFGIINILPGNVAYAILGEFATPSAIATLEAKLGLNDPLWMAPALQARFDGLTNLVGCSLLFGLLMQSTMDCWP